MNGQHNKKEGILFRHLHYTLLYYANVFYKSLSDRSNAGSIYFSLKEVLFLATIL